MARSYGKVLASRNGDSDWRVLSRDAQWLYDALISQSRLTLAGSLDLMPTRWATLAVGTSVADVERALDELAGARFVAVDRATEEVVIRTLVRHDLDNNRLNSNTIKGLWSAWAGIISPVLRKVVVDNLPEIVWEKSGKATPELAEQMRRSPRFEPPVPTARPDQPTEPPDHTTSPDGPTEPPSPSPSPSPSTGACSLKPAAERDPRAMSPAPDPALAAGPVDNSGSEQADSPPPADIDETLTAAASSMAWAETDRRHTAGEIANPDGYQRSRVKPIRAQHEPAWRRILEHEPASTPQQLVDAVTGHGPGANSSVPSSPPLPVYVAPLGDDPERAWAGPPSEILAAWSRLPRPGQPDAQETR